MWKIVDRIVRGLMMPSGVYDHSKRRTSIETRVCVFPGCSNTFEVKITNGKRHCSRSCSDKSRKGKTYEEIYGDRTEEQKAKHRIPASEEKKAKQSASMKGKNTYPRTEESNRKRREKLLNRVFSEETLKNMQESKRKFAQENPGFYAKENNGNWQGGVSNLPYSFEFNEEFKTLIRERDNHTCQLCGKTKEQEGRSLCVHHISYDKKNDCSDEDDFITLCDSCNGKVNGNRDYWAEFFQSRLKLSKVS